jgi:hypothetical protein
MHSMPLSDDFPHTIVHLHDIEPRVEVAATAIVNE